MPAKTDLDHALLLQLERAYEHLNDRVEGIATADDECECSCGEMDIEDLRDDLRGLEDDVADLSKKLDKLIEQLTLDALERRIAALEAKAGL